MTAQLPDDTLDLAYETSSEKAARRLATRVYLLGLQGGCCAYCRRPLDSAARGGGPEAPTIDHVIPKRHGAHRNHIANYVVACGRCNKRRAHLPISDWLAVCKWRGWRPQTDVIVGRLEELIAMFGESEKLAPQEIDRIRRKVVFAGWRIPGGTTTAGVARMAVAG